MVAFLVSMLRPVVRNLRAGDFSLSSRALKRLCIGLPEGLGEGGTDWVCDVFLLRLILAVLVIRFSLISK